MLLLCLDGGVFIFFFLILLTIIFQVEIAINSLLPIAQVLFLILHVIHCIVYMIRKKSIEAFVSGVVRLVMSVIRIELYFSLLQASINEANDTIGFLIIFSLFGFVFVFIILGAVFLLAEACSLTFDFVDDTDPSRLLIPEMILTAIIIASFFWLIL